MLIHMYMYMYVQVVKIKSVKMVTARNRTHEVKMSNKKRCKNGTII